MPVITPDGTYLYTQTQDGGKVTAVRWRRPLVLYAIEDNLTHYPFMGNPRDAIRRAADKWARHVAPSNTDGEGIILREARRDEVPNIRVKMVRANLLRLGGGGYELGHTTLSYLPDSPIQDLEFVVVNIRELITPWLNNTTTEAVALHEFGHALGIRGHPINVNSIMVEAVPRKAELGVMDISTIRWIYENK